jgi:hypothetical protein
MNVVSFCAELSPQRALDSWIVFNNQNQTHSHSPAPGMALGVLPAKAFLYSVHQEGAK